MVKNKPWKIKHGEKQTLEGQTKWRTNLRKSNKVKNEHCRVKQVEEQTLEVQRREEQTLNDNDKRQQQSKAKHNKANINYVK